MKKMFFLLSIIIFSISAAMGQQAPSPWDNVPSFPQRIEGDHQQGFGLVFIKPAEKINGSISVSALEVLIKVPTETVVNGKKVKAFQIIRAPLNSIELGLNTQSIDWQSIFDQPATKMQDGRFVYHQPIMVTYHIFQGHHYITL